MMLPLGVVPQAPPAPFTPQVAPMVLPTGAMHLPAPLTPFVLIPAPHGIVAPPPVPQSPLNSNMQAPAPSTPFPTPMPPPAPNTPIPSQMMQTPAPNTPVPGQFV